MKKIFYTLLVITLFISCEEDIELDTIFQDERVVIDALITDQIKNQYVVVTRTIDFNANGNTPRVDDATVVVSITSILILSC